MSPIIVVPASIVKLPVLVTVPATNSSPTRTKPFKRYILLAVHVTFPSITPSTSTIAFGGIAETVTGIATKEDT